MYYISRFLFNLYVRLFKRGWLISGRENIPKTGPCIVVANHIGDSDPWCISGAFPARRPIHWLSKRELYSIKKCYQECRDDGRDILTAAFLALGTVCLVSWSMTIPVDRDNNFPSMNKAAIKRSQMILKAGGVVGVFGTGGQNRQNVAKPIFVMLSVACKASILPIHIGVSGVTIGSLITAGELEKNLKDQGGDRTAVARSVLNRIDTLAVA